jgi:acetyltransferase-like isoleucine patch superfamily enzyme
MKTLNAIDFRLFLGCPCHIKDQIVFTSIDGINIKNNKVICEGVSYDPSEVKLILRSFGSISRHEIEHLNTLWPKESIKRTVEDSVTLDANIVDYLTSINVDVFQWIDKGLAIDAAYNTNLINSK